MRRPNMMKTNINQEHDEEEKEDDTWELARAFAADTRSSTNWWPPRSYTCTFCRREFRSAQALGGHMNVHRRDRAHLHQAQAQPLQPTGPTTTNCDAFTCTKDIVRLNEEEVAIEELDLELRLGHVAPASSESSRFLKNNSNNVAVLHWR